MKVHPAADAWPMLGEGDLQALADDIAKNGLRHPITVWQGQVIDGRNRLAACEIAGVEPASVEADLPDEDAVLAFIESENEHRRHLSKGQRAIALARMYASKNDWSPRLLSKREGSPTAGYLSQAAFVVHHRPGLAELAMTDPQGYSLTKAYEEARKQVAAETADAVQADRDRLAREAPDLLALVDIGDLTVAGAINELNERLVEDARRRRVTTSLVDESLGSWLGCFVGKADQEEIVSGMANRYEGALTAQDVREAASLAARLADAMEEHD